MAVKTLSGRSLKIGLYAKGIRTTVSKVAFVVLGTGGPFARFPMVV